MLGWALAAFAVAIFMVTCNNSGMVLRAGLLAKAFAVVIGTLLGDSICRFARPPQCLPVADSSVWCSPSCHGLQGLR